MLQITQIYTCFYQESHSNFHFRREIHRPYELTYIERGCLHNLVNGSDIVLQQSQLLIIDRDSWHMQYSDEPVAFLTVVFDLSNDLLGSVVNKCLSVPSDARNPLDRFLLERTVVSPFTYDYLTSLVTRSLQLDFNEVIEPLIESGHAVTTYGILRHLNNMNAEGQQEAARSVAIIAGNPDYQKDKE